MNYIIIIKLLIIQANQSEVVIIKILLMIKQEIKII